MKEPDILVDDKSYFKNYEKKLFISFKKLFPFSRHSKFCNFFPSFSHFPDLKGQIKLEQL